MIDSLYLARMYLRYHKGKTTILVCSVTLIVFLPVGLSVLVNESAQQLRSRAGSTPLILGSKASELELVLNTLYFQSKQPPSLRMAEVHRVRQSGFADAIPLYVRFHARGRPIVATVLEYFEFRNLKIANGRHLAKLGDCVVGSSVARGLSLKTGDTLMSAPENAFEFAGVYPLKMPVVGVLSPTGGPDDDAVFVDLKTAWIIEGLGHGHVDVTRPEASDLQLGREGSRVTANAAVVQFNEITPDNVDTFHFHGDQSDFPLTAIIAVPHDEKSRTLLMGRHLSSSDSTQVVRPTEVMDELLATILRVRRFMLAGSLLIGLSTVLMAVLVFLLSVRLRRGELETIRKLGSSRFRVAAILTCEVLLVVGVSGCAAGMLTVITLNFGDEAIRWFIF
jgi:putative ABC transport system permease protein